MIGIFKLFFLVCVFTLSACDSSITARLDSNLDNIKAWKTYNPIEPVLYHCVRALSLQQSCTVEQLPLIRMQHSIIDRDAVLDRLMVSDQWMGDNFIAYLDSLPVGMEADLLELFGSVTAIVIDENIKPSYFSLNTGAIYLDPDNLWFSLEEYQSLPKRVDYRVAFARELSFIATWAYLDANGDLLYPRSFTAPRTAQNIQVGFSSLLFHELAHANDVFPASEIGALNSSSRLRFIADDLYYQGKLISQKLAKQFPLDATNPWFSLANVMFRGAQASAIQKAYSAADVGAFLDADVANDEYSYSNNFEDLAMLFEELMMLKYFNAQRELAYLTPLLAQPQFCTDYQVGWAMLHRIAKPSVWQRGEFVTTTIIPNIDLSQLLLTYTDGVYQPTGGDWCHSLPLVNKSLGSDVFISPQKAVLPPFRPEFSL